MRKKVAIVGYVLLGCSVLTALILWPFTCGMGGFHCTDGVAGGVMYAAQIGVLVGLVCSLFGRSYWRLAAIVVALIQFGACFRQALVH